MILQRNILVTGIYDEKLEEIRHNLPIFFQSKQCPNGKTTTTHTDKIKEMQYKASSCSI